MNDLENIIMPSGASVDEQETIIQISRDGTIANIWTNDPTMVTKIKRANSNNKYKIIKISYDTNGNPVAYEFETPKKLIGFRSGGDRVVTEEQRAAARDRLINLRSGSKTDEPDDLDDQSEDDVDDEE